MRSEMHASKMTTTSEITLPPSISLTQTETAKPEKPVEEMTTIGPKISEGEMVFGVAHIFASFNDTFVVS